MRKFFAILLLVIVGYANADAQVTDSLQAQLLRKWINAKAYTLSLAELIPEQDYDFKPVPEEMSVREQLMHIAQNIKWLSSSYLSIKVPTEKKDSLPKSKAEILKIVADAYNYGAMAHQQLLTSQLDEMVTFFAGPKSKRQIVVLMHDHQGHHLGQLIVYVRLRGIKPPPYIGW